MRPRYGPPAREREGGRQSSSSGSARGSEERRQDTGYGRDDWRRGNGGVIFVPTPDGPYPDSVRRPREPRVTFEREDLLWEVPVSGGIPTSVPGLPRSGVRQPTRSPVWGRLAFIAPPGDLVWITAEGRKPRTVVRATFGRIGQPAWSPDDRRLAFVSDAGGSDDLYLIGERGGRPERLPGERTSKRSPAFSSNGSNLYFVSDHDGVSRLYERFLHQSKDLLIPDIIVPTPPGEVVSVATARNSPNVVVCILGPDRRRQLWLIRPMTRIAAPHGEPILISDGRGDDDQPALSPDGTRVVFRTTERGRRSIILWNRTTGQAERLTDGPDDSHPTIW